MNSLFIQENENGRVSYKKDIIADIALKAMRLTEGKATPAYNGAKKLKAMISGKVDPGFVECEASGSSYNITLNIGLLFGTSISEITNLLNAEIRRDVPVITGMEVRKLTILILTITSGKNIAKRNIEVSFYA
jgi:uncharacterized alkaline shock family protein YloU